MDATPLPPAPFDSPSGAELRISGRVRLVRWIAAALAIVLVAVVAGAAARGRVAWTAYDPQEGDILFQSLPRSELVNCIEGATGSPWSHCGIVAREGGRWYVYEAIVEVRRTPLNDFYSRGRQGRFAVYRLREEYRTAIPELLNASKEYLGRPYDARYRMDDDAIYCSELIFKAFRTAARGDLGKTVTLGQLKWRPYRTLIEHLEGGPVPVEREMITPRDLALAPQLEFVTGYDVPAP